ncbi:X-ray repair cross-complementing protein 5-like [Diadema antillarum]|uniref:X-ray repair cross-complementing protein 5-like n=1 Tax=Diadema antillarum TaxID=105358 RepID=UPI003A871DD6
MGSREKEAIVICLDVGPSMNQAAPGHCTSLETACDVITMILQRKVLAESKDEIALLLFGTPGTANRLSDEGYENITEERPFKMADLDFIQHIRTNIHPSPVSGDCIDALVVAMDMIHTAISDKGAKFTQNRIILFSDLGGEFADDKLEQVIGGLKSMKTEVNHIGLQFEEDEDESEDHDRPSTSSNSRGGGPQKAKTPQQRAGEQLIKHILQQVDGQNYTFQEVIPAVTMFEKRAVRPTPWKVNLEIGSELKIPVSGYLKVKETPMRSWKSTYQKGPNREYTPKTIRSKHLNDDEETEVESEDMVEGHRYGNDIIPISEEDKKNMDYQKPGKVMQVLGFTKDTNIKKHHQMGSSVYIFVPQPDDQAAAMAFSALTNALYETNSVAIIRRAYSASSNPRIGFLVPHIKAKYEALFYIELPFAEDLRMYTFASLDNNKKCKPTDEQLEAIDGLIDEMDLMNAKEDEDEDEPLKPKNTLNPYTQRLCQCLMHRALNPDDPLPDIQEAIASYLQLPRAVAVRCEPQVEKVKGLFKLEKVKAKENVTGDTLWKAGDQTNGEPASKKARMDDDANDGDLTLAGMTKGAVTEVGTVDPCGDFRAMISQKDEDRFKEAAKQMGERVLELVRKSFGAQLYSKALECLRVYREEAIKLSEPETFNDYIRKLKEELKELQKTDFWQDVTKDNVTLIDSSESSDSKVTREEAEKFIQEEEVPMEEEPAAAEPEEDADDLLDMM